MPNQQRPTFLQAILIAGAGILVAFFSCLGAIAGFSSGGSNSAIGDVGVAGFVLGILVFLVGAVLLLIVVIRPFFKKSEPPATPAAAAAVPPINHASSDAPPSDAPPVDGH